MTPCPAGWREVVDANGATSCDPFPESGQAECASGMAHFLGETGCSPIGRACPATDFGEVPAGVPVIYVLEAAAAGGDGTEGAPFRNLSDVPWGSMAPGTVVALGKGEYAGSFDLPAGAHIIGACVAETVLVGDEVGVMLPVIRVGTPGDPVVLEGFSFRLTPRLPIYVDVGSALELDGVLFDRSSGLALSAIGAGITITARNIVVRDGVPRPPGAGTAGGRGFDVRGGASLTIERAVFSGNSEANIIALMPGTSVSLTDTVIRNTAPAPDGFGTSLFVVQGATAEVTRTLLDAATNTGVLIGDTGSIVRMTDVIVRGTRPAPDGTLGVGIVVELGGVLEANRLVVEDNHLFGIWAKEAGSRVELTDAIVRDTSSQQSDGIAGFGLRMMQGAASSLTRVLVARSQQTGIAVFDPDSSLEATDLVVRDTLPDDNGLGGRGLAVEDGGRVVAERLLLTMNTEAGFMAHHGTDLSLVDSAILDTQPQAISSTLGFGAVVGFDSTLTATRLEIARAYSIGLLVHSEDTQVTLTDVAIRDIEPEVMTTLFGYGIHVQHAAAVTGERILVQNAVGLGVSAMGVGASAALTDVTIEGVRQSPYADLPLGFAAAALSGSLTLERFRISDAATCGLIVSPAIGLTAGGQIDLSSGIVEGAAIGACVQVEDYDLARLRGDVVYRDNETNLDTTSLPVPDVVGAPD